MIHEIKMEIEVCAYDMLDKMIDCFGEELYNLVPTSVYDYLYDTKQWNDFVLTMWQHFLEEI